MYEHMTNATPTKLFEGSSLTHEENEYVEFKVSNMEDRIKISETTMTRKIDILDMVGKT